MSPADVRKSPRFRVTLRTQITGVDDAPVLRCGDISSSGLFLEADRDVGRIGSMQRLELSAEDGSCPLVLLARVVRIASVEDFWKGRTVAGVALQFMFVEEPGTDTRCNTARPACESVPLQDLLKQLIHQDAARYGVEVQSWRGTLLTEQGGRAATLHEMSPRRMAIETDRPVELGEIIRVEMPGPPEHERPSFAGEVAACQPMRARPGQRERYRVIVQFGPPTPRGAPRVSASIDDAFEALLSAVTSPPAPTDTEVDTRHLAGELSRISLFSVVTLCQLERVTGSLMLKDGISTIRVYIEAGELVDAVAEGRDLAPRAVLKEVIAWNRGSFEVVFGQISRAHRLTMATSALLLDLAQELDETTRTG